MRGERPGFNADGTPIKVTKLKKTAAIADKVVGTVVGNTIGRVGRFVGKRLLGRIPDEAFARANLKAEVSAVSTVVAEPVAHVDKVVNINEKTVSMEISSADQVSLEHEIAQQVFSSTSSEAAEASRSTNQFA